jgi:hypothetical protein
VARMIFMIFMISVAVRRSTSSPTSCP